MKTNLQGMATSLNLNNVVSYYKVNPRWYFSPLVIFNLLLSLAVVVTLFSHVIQSNKTASNRYKITTLTNQLSSIQEENSNLANQRSALLDPVQLISMARSLSMIQARDVEYMVESGNVALQR